MLYKYKGQLVTASSKKEAIHKIKASSKWSESELAELGLTEKELKQFSDKTKKEVCEVS